jgi:hypothetical protein
MTRRTQLVCTWLAPAGLIGLVIGLWPIAGYVPPRAANLTATQIADFYRDNTTAIRFGLTIALFCVMFWGPLVGVIARQMLRMKPKNNVLAYVQIVAGAAAWTFLTVPVIVLLAASFRPDRSPQITQALHDLGWFLTIIPYVPFTIQYLALGIAILQDDPTEPVFPRWAGYFNIWVALLLIPVTTIAFAKSGAISYQGLIAFWVPFAVFGAWLVVMPCLLHKAITNEAASEVDQDRTGAAAHELQPAL